MPSTMHHISMIVQNTERSLHLFRDLLGFDLIWHLPRVKEPIFAKILCIPDVELELAYLQGINNQVAIELVGILGPKNSGSDPIADQKSSTMSISVKVNDIDLFYEQLAVEGWQPYTDIMPIRSPDGGQGRIFCFHTDEGVMIEIIEMAAIKSNKDTTH